MLGEETPDSFPGPMVDSRLQKNGVCVCGGGLGIYVTSHINTLSSNVKLYRTSHYKVAGTLSVEVFLYH